MKKKLIVSLLVVVILIIGGIFVFGNGGSNNTDTATTSQTNSTQTVQDMSIIPTNLNELIPQVVAKIGQPNVYVIDVRTQEEWNAGLVKGAMLWGLAERLQMNQLPDISKDAEVYLYCHSGNRATQAAKIMQAAGFTNITNLGAFQTWIDAGGPVEST